MCDLQCGNLIDLDLEEDSAQAQAKVPPSAPTTHLSSLVPDVQFVSPSLSKRDSLDNNPFDCVQKLANQRQDDPFDIVEKEACFKARLSCLPRVEVKLGNLLSLSSDNVDVSDDVQPDLEANGKKVINKNDLGAESPPVAMMEKHMATGSCSETDSNPYSSAESAGSSKLKKAKEYRKRLLKLSCTNSALNSPASCRSSLDDPGTPLSALLSKSSQYCENLLAAESPLKFIDDDIMPEESPSSLDAQKKFEADLEMLKIPMLNEIPSTESDDFLNDIENNILESLNCMETCGNGLTGLEVTKAKLKAKSKESNNNHQDINTLISDLKSLINSGDTVNDTTKMQASSILETLSSALSTSEAKDIKRESQHEDDHHDHIAVPQPIIRQGTFDIELQEDKDRDLVKQPFVHEMPNCMTSSSATYDGDDAPEEKHILDLPEIEPPEKSLSGLALQSDMNDIVEQLSKIFIHNNSGDNSSNMQQHPTFIVVMNNTPMQLNHSNFGAKENSTKAPSYLDDSHHDNSPDLNESSTIKSTRRRSQSLSIHDKVKIVQLPLKPPTPNKRMVDVRISPPVVTTPPSNDLSTPEFKTPARMVRRNSFSTGTPYTSAVGFRKTGFSSEANSATHVRRNSTLNTHHEVQQQQQKAIVRPMTLPTNNMASFKPDLKKKHKAQSESIMKSSGPLKATIPVKKVAPMIKLSPPSPGHESLLSGCSFDNSAQLTTKKIPTTPLSSSRPLSKLGLGPGYPKACSTPSSALSSPMKRTSIGVSKPRYSFMATATPNSKSTTASAASQGLKRRSITDFKVRAPLKSRVSTAGLSAAAASGASTSSRISVSSSRLSSSSSSSRLSTSACPKIPSKAPTKLAPNAAAVKPAGRIVQPRLSGVGPNRSTRNKENKNP